MSRQQGKDWEFANHVAHLVMRNNGMIYGDFVIQSILSQHHSAIEPPSTMEMCISYDNMTKLLRDCRMNNLVAYPEADDESSYFDRADHQRNVKYMVALDSMYWQQVASKYPISLDIHELTEQCKSVAPLHLVVTHTFETLTEPPFETLDFECNSLFITNHCINVSSQVEIHDNDVLCKYKTVSRIMDDIAAKKTRLMYSCSAEMAEKAKSMLSEGWTIYDDILTSVCDSNETDLCILCHEKVMPLHFKLNCCEARYHGKCLKRCIEAGYTTKCCMCRSDVFLDEPHSVMLGDAS
jgi:hypothetical protein